ncbi:MAG TPA: hypothetical protein VFE46_16895 [Pirellulales bacterium]|jgi:hypothetical protein|nr:hypothetical protein [Pirellulales bacterium]
MALLNWLQSPASPRQIAAWGLEVAQQCQNEVALRLGQTVHRLSLPAARGYIRARAAAVLEEEMNLLLERTGCSSALAAAIRNRAMDDIVRMAIGDVLKTARPLVQRKAA